MSYRVRYYNPEKPGSGFIDGFKRAARAREAVAKWNELYDRTGSGLRAEYLGQDRRPAAPSSEEV